MIDRRELASATKRNTTDLTCCVLFVAFTLTMLISGLYAYFKGSITKFNIPHDSDGKGCGIQYPNFSYIYFPSPQYDSLWVTTCVKQCPSDDHTTVECQTNSAVPACTQNNSPDNLKAFHIYGTEVYRGSVCLPKDQTIREKVLAGIGARTIEEMFGSVIKDWSLFLLVSAIALGMSMGAFLLIRLTAGYVVYVLYGIAISAFIGFGIYLLVPSQNESFFLKKSKIVSYVFSFLSFFVAAVILCFFCSHRQRIKSAVQYINKSNQFLKNNYIILMLPFILAGLALLFLYFWIFLSLSFYSVSEPAISQRQLPFEHYKLTPLVLAMLFINLFYLVWGMLFLMHSGSLIVSGTVVNWQLKRQSPYLTSAKNYLFAHLGSVAMGSFLTALLGAFKFELDEADCAQRERQAESENRCIDCLKRCYGCFCCCCIAFIFRCFHHGAYAYQNLSGLPYCQSSTEIYELVRSERQKWSIVAFLYLIFDQFIPLVIGIVNILIANALIQTVELFKDNTSNRLLVFIVVGIVTYAIAHYFIAIYSETIQTLFVIEQFHSQLLPNNEEYPLQLQAQLQKHKSLPSERYYSSLPSEKYQHSLPSPRYQVSLQPEKQYKAVSEKPSNQRHSLFPRN